MTAQPFFVPALLILLLAVPLAVGLVPRNRVYGVRTARTLTDADAWERANRFGGRVLGAAAWLVQLGAFLLPLLVGGIAIARHVRSL